ncbi:adenylate kinase [Tenuifilaceae bacterium CYCD]|nr:adenylate kinase [Tenuifilaceae bacterium CYCD]
MLNIVIFGPPGAGKGTQSKIVAQEFGLKHISTGEILRAAIVAQTPIGIEAKRLIDKGNFVSDEIAIGLIEEELSKDNAAKGCVFDGFPRNTLQAAKLDEILCSTGYSVTVMISLEVTDDELVDRLLNRGKETDRPDDKEESIIRKRLDIYDKTTRPVLDYYKNQEKFKGIDGMGSVNQIFDRICKAIRNAQ